MVYDVCWLWIVDFDLVGGGYLLIVLIIFFCVCVLLCFTCGFLLTCYGGLLYSVMVWVCLDLLFVV